MTKVKVSQSKASVFNTCHMKYHLKYVRKLRRRRVARPLTFGSAVHKVIEDRMLGTKATPRLRKKLDVWAAAEMKKMNYFTAEHELFQEAIDDAWMVSREYLNYWPADHLTPIEVNGSKAEIEFEYEPPKEEFAINGKIDLYTRSQNGLVWLTEHKTGKQMMKEEDRWRSIQAAVYGVVGRELGHPEIDGIAWDMIRSKTPTKPRLLQAGTFSLAKLDSIPTVVYETIKEAGQDPNDYPTLLASVEANLPNWFKRTFQPVSTDVQQFLYDDFTETARTIVDMGHKVNKMNVGRHCTWCDFEAICRARMSGDDAEYVVEKEFTHAEETTKGPKKLKPRKKKAKVGRRKLRSK